MFILHSHVLYPFQVSTIILVIVDTYFAISNIFGAFCDPIVVIYTLSYLRVAGPRRGYGLLQPRMYSGKAQIQWNLACERAA